MKKVLTIAAVLLAFVAVNVNAAPAAKGKAPVKKAATTQKAPAKKAAATPAKKAPAKAAAPAKKAFTIAKDPYIGAIVVDADTGETLFEENADAPGYPASTLKLMTLYVVQDKIERGDIKLTDMVPVSVKAYKTGGSQVYLDPKETFPLEELLYALMIQSANDAAVAIAEFVSGSTEGFVDDMNKKAQELGMENTRFASPHGLPPAPGQKDDVTTARDMSILCRELAKHPDIFKYTSAAVRWFRPEGAKGRIEMRTHNPFLKEGMAGCDGLKTGFTVKAGWSIAVSCKRGERRVLVYVLGSTDRKLRDAKARELVSRFAR